ncbi:MAG: hypothetical protein OXP69_04160 [Spirochaetaceae bacterium]|nr:hypothetical protein [Spirochaetaceae bacterium]
MADVPIVQMFTGFGITAAESQQKAWTALVKAGVISGRPNRTNIAMGKAERARACLAANFLWHCNHGDCRAHVLRDDAPREPLLVDQASCAICGGSSDRKALARMASAMAKAGLSRILVVGGTTAKEQQMRQETGVEWRFIYGKAAPPDRLMRSYRRWAEIIVIWASTPLKHRVSAHFVGKGHRRVITVSKRGIVALADAVISSVE